MNADAPKRAATAARVDMLDELLTEPGDLDALMALVDALEPAAPSPSVRASILAASSEKGRLHRFAEAIAGLIDVTADKARELLDRVADTSRWERLFPGLDALWVEGGPAAAACIRGFARLEAGLEFPDHAHLGEEATLVLEGAMVESGGATVQPGEIFRMPAGSTHSYRAAPGRTDLLFFVVVRTGLTLPDGQALRHRDG